jgi:hypothetical protein
MPINGWSLRNTSKITSRGYEFFGESMGFHYDDRPPLPAALVCRSNAELFRRRDANVLPSGDRARTHNRRRRASDRLGPITFGILGAAVVAGQPTSASAQSYPWCAQGDSIVHCYYMTREQCEAAVNYHGFCLANSSMPTPNNEAPQPRLQRRR